MGRFCIYDSVTYTLLSKPGAISSLLWISSLQASYNFYHVIPYTANYFYGAAFMASVISINKLNKLAARVASVNRIYLMSDLKQVLIQNGFGKTIQIPINEFQIVKFTPETNQIRAKAGSNSTNSISLRMAENIHFPLLYAVLN